MEMGAGMGASFGTSGTMWWVLASSAVSASPRPLETSSGVGDVSRPSGYFSYMRKDNPQLTIALQTGGQDTSSDPQKTSPDTAICLGSIPQHLSSLYTTYIIHLQAA